MKAEEAEKCPGRCKKKDSQSAKDVWSFFTQPNNASSVAVLWS